MNKSIKQSMILRGTVERRLFDTKRLNIVKEAIKQGLSSQEIETLKRWAAKPQFKQNRLWKLLKSLFNADIQIPFVTGYWTLDAIGANLIPTAGKKIVAEQVGGTTTTPVTAIAIGIGTTAANAADVALESEIVNNGGQRGAATVSNTTTTTAGDTEQWQKTFNFTGSFAITEEGLLDNNAAGGKLLARQVFAAVNVQNGDSLQITHKVKVS